MSWIQNHLRACPICGSIHEIKFILCDFCWNELCARSQPANLLITKTNINFKYLWSWEQDQDRGLSQFLKAIKYHPQDKDWDHIAGEFSLRLQAAGMGPENKDFVFVPCPSSSKGIRDHAALLAEALGRYWSMPVCKTLEKTDDFNGPQKTKEKWQRASVTVRLIEKNSQSIPLGSHIVLIDDILTTGSTAKASIQSLGPGYSYEVWCLAHRRLAASRAL